MGGLLNKRPDVRTRAHDLKTHVTLAWEKASLDLVVDEAWGLLETLHIVTTQAGTPHNCPVAYPVPTTCGD